MNCKRSFVFFAVFLLTCFRASVGMHFLPDKKIKRVRMLPCRSFSVVYKNLKPDENSHIHACTVHFYDVQTGLEQDGQFKIISPEQEAINKLAIVRVDLSIDGNVLCIGFEDSSFDLYLTRGGRKINDESIQVDKDRAISWVDVVDNVFFVKYKDGTSDYLSIDEIGEDVLFVDQRLNAISENVMPGVRFDNNEIRLQSGKNLKNLRIPKFLVF